MDRSDLQHVSQEQLIELVLRLQRPIRICARPQSRLPRTRRKSVRAPDPGERNLGMSRTIGGWPTTPTNSAVIYQAFASGAVELSRRRSEGIDRRIRRGRDPDGQALCHPPPRLCLPVRTFRRDETSRAGSSRASRTTCSRSTSNVRPRNGSTLTRSFFSRAASR
jgi:hypothetical protein